MDPTAAHSMAAQLSGCTIGEWRIEGLINSGKSAVVLKGFCGAEMAAVKVFDRDMVKRFGEAVQLERIERELALVGQTHPNLVKILGGGKDVALNVLYVVMEFIPAKNLQDQIDEIPAARISTILKEVASAAKFLETLNLAHRDIKPENIALTSERAILLDLGVIRPIGGSTITDDNFKEFIGTLQYSPPEFLLRQEEDSVEGWRAVTFYQIAAVLHDLIMKVRIFHEYEHPFARLVDAVRQVVPNLRNMDAPAHLCDIARRGLMKSPGQRTRFLSWEALLDPDSHMRAPPTERLRTRILSSRPVGPTSPQPTQSDAQREAIATIEAIFRSRVLGKQGVPPMKLRPGTDKLDVRVLSSSVHGLSLDMHVRCHIQVEPGAIHGEPPIGELILIAVGFVEPIDVLESFIAVATQLVVYSGPFLFDHMADTLEKHVILLLERALDLHSIDGPSIDMMQLGGFDA